MPKLEQEQQPHTSYYMEVFHLGSVIISQIIKEVIMKKFLSILMAVLVLFLASCAPTQSEEVEEATVGKTVTNDYFKLSIVADKSVYKADEAISCYALLEVMGEEQITVLHSDPLVVFYVEGEKYFEGDYIRQDSLNRTTFAPGDEKRFEFQKSGGWSEDDPNASFYEEFYSDNELRLSSGQYMLGVQIEYSTDENDMRGTQQTLEALVSITVD